MITALASFGFRPVLFLVLVSLLVAEAGAADVTAIRRKLLDPAGGVIIVAHRGCHNAHPAFNIAAAPENSLLALANCVAMGVDMMEFDIRRTKDGALVIMHDATVNRMTNGTGRIDQMTVSEFRALRLKENFGGQMAPQLTDLPPPTLRELLAAAKGKIMLNLDLKDDVYDAALAEVVAAGMANDVIAKRIVDDENAEPLADKTPYNQALFMPILQTQAGKVVPENLAAIARRQASGSHRIPALELLYLRYDELTTLRAVAKEAGIRLWSNNLTQVGVKSVVDFGGDIDGLRDPDRVWGDAIREGLSIFQTDEPGPMIAWLKHKGLR